MTYSIDEKSQINTELKIPNIKYHIPNNFQISITKTPYIQILEFGA
jgi:hypothetical protein